VLEKRGKRGEPEFYPAPAVTRLTADVLHFYRFASRPGKPVVLQHKGNRAGNRAYHGPQGEPEAMTTVTFPQLRHLSLERLTKPGSHFGINHVQAENKLCDSMPRARVYVRVDCRFACRQSSRRRWYLQCPCIWQTADRGKGGGSS
jgi:hypothetical protein